MTNNEIIKTDEQIIKALESVKNNPKPFSLDDKVMISALELINRLNEKDKKNERIIELNDKLIKTQSTEIDFLRASKNLHEAEFNEAKVELELKKAEIERLKEEVKVLKEIQQKVLSEQGTYTTNDKTVCGDCENLWLKTLLENKAEIDRLKEANQKLVEAAEKLTIARKEVEIQAYKKFEERLKEYSHFTVADLLHIKNLVKEMEGDE